MIVIVIVIDVDIVLILVIVLVKVAIIDLPWIRTSTGSKSRLPIWIERRSGSAIHMMRSSSMAHVEL